MIFFYDWSTESLVFSAPPDERPASISAKRLRELGWYFNEADARKNLPRFDRALIDIARGGRRR